jgi:hypothetical protein
MYDNHGKNRSDEDVTRRMFSIEKQVIALVYYVTNYLGKDDLKSGSQSTAVSCVDQKKQDQWKQALGKGAAKELKERAKDDADIEDCRRASRLTQKCVNSIFAGREVPSNLIMMYLQGFDDYFCSHKMVDLVFGPMVDYLGGKPTDKPASSRKPTDKPICSVSTDDQSLFGTLGISDQGQLCVLGDLRNYIDRPYELEAVPAKNFMEYYSLDGATRMSSSCMALRPTHPRFKTMVVRPRDNPL